jgi:hypothetical protein
MWMARSRTLYTLCRIWGYEEYCLLEYNAMWSVTSQPTFWRNISPPSSWWNKPSNLPLWKQVANYLGMPPTFMLVSCSAYSTLKLEAMCSSETLVGFLRTAWYYIPEDDNTFHIVDAYSKYYECLRVNIYFGAVHWLCSWFVSKLL